MVENLRTLLDTLAQCGADDLAAIDQEIAAKEDELAAATSERRKAIDALKRLREVLNVQVNGKPAKVMKRQKTVATPERRSDGGTFREKIYDFLSKQDFPKCAKDIAIGVGCSIPTVYQAVDHEWFAKSLDGYEIAKA